MRNTCKLVRGGVAYAISGRLDSVHFNTGQIGQDVGDVFQLGPVELNVLAGGEVGIATIIFACNRGQHAHLPRRNQAVRNRHPEHRRMLLYIQTILQTQRAEFVLGQIASQKSFRLVTKLRDALVNNGLVVLIVFVHISFGSRPGLRSSPDQ